MKIIELDVIKCTATGTVSEGDVGAKLIISNLPREWDNCSIFALFTQDKQSKHVKIGDDHNVVIPKEFTDTNKAFQIGVYAVGGDLSRDVRPSVWIRVENTEFTTEDLIVTEQSIDMVLELQSMSAAIEDDEKERKEAEEVRQANESARIEADNNRKTELVDIKRRLSGAETDIDKLEDGKVDKIDGMGLSQNSYTDHDAGKLAGIEPGAQKNAPVDQTYQSASSNAQSGKAVADAIAKLVNGSPEALDTLYELANALGNNPNFATTVMDALGKKVDKVDGMGLSSNDFSDDYKDKLLGVTNMITRRDFPDINDFGDFSFADGLLGEGYGTTIYYGVTGGWNNYMLTVIKTSEDTVRYIQYGFLNSDGSVNTSDVCALKYRYGVYESYEDYETGETHYYINWSSWAEFLTEETVKKILYPKPISTVHNPLRKNTSYNFGEVSDLNLKFPGSYASNDGDVIYITFYVGDNKPTIIIDFTSASDIDIEITPNTGYEIFAKYNGEIWIVGWSEYKKVTS